MQVFMNALPSTSRLLSLDLFRGCVILAMIFVNTLADIGVNNVPALLQHAEWGVNTITFADLVFPAFIFMMGMSIPFALSKLTTGGASLFVLLKHIALRGAALIFLGFVVMNAEEHFSDTLTGMSFELWSNLATAGILLLFVDTRATILSSRKWVRLGLKIAGGLLLATMLILFRGQTEEGAAIGLVTGWWGILGIIGWSYMAASLVYLVSRNSRSALAGTIGIDFHSIHAQPPHLSKFIDHFCLQPLLALRY